MAKQASGSEWSIFQDFMPELERFAALVAEENDKKWQELITKMDEYAAACNKSIKLSSDLSLAAIDVAIAVEREACARVCEDRALKNEQACDSADTDETISLRSAAWQLSTCAAAIRERR